MQKCKHFIYILDFSEILCDGMHWKRSKSVFYFSKQLWLHLRIPSLDVFGHKIDMFHISCFIALFFLIVLRLNSGYIVTLYLFLLGFLMCSGGVERDQWHDWNGLTFFTSMFHFYIPWKLRKTFGFLTFSVDIKMGHWREKTFSGNIKMEHWREKTFSGDIEMECWRKKG